MALTKITKTGIGADAIDGNKLGDNSISEEHLDTSVLTDFGELSTTAAGDDILLIYDTSAGTLKKIQSSNVGLQAPTISSVSPTNVTSGDGTGNYTFTITGTGYVASAVPTLVENGGTSVSFDSFTIDSQTQITGVIAKSSLSNAQEPYDVKVTTAGALTSTLTNQINIDAQPVFNTASGSVGSFAEQSTISTIDIEAYDPESAGNVTFEIQSGSLPGGLSATTINENGVSKYRITGTLTTDVSVLTTNNFTLRAVDAASNTSSRAFSITEVPSGIESFTSDGTFSVPTGITSVDVLVVGGGGGGGSAGGGGGGSGGLIFMPGYPVTPGGTVSVTVGCGGQGAGTSASPTTSAYPTRPAANHLPGGNGQDSVFGQLTAKGGGGGGGRYPAPQSGPGEGDGGGSGGGGGSNVPSPAGGPGPAIQPTQPGNSGAYGFGGQGGQGSVNITPVQGYTMNGGGGGGGGAGGNGGNGPSGGGYQLSAGNGGVGKAYTIADGTTPVYYAGGGGGGSSRGPGCYAAPSGAASGGQGGGGQGANQSPAFGGGPDALSPNPADAGEANKGGGGGGGSPIPGCDTVGKRGGEAGGKGVVIVKY